MSERPRLFGRERELAAVAAFLDGLPSGPSGLLLEGEPGIGKTTVWTAGISAAAARSYLVLSARPTESEATLSFAALGDLLDGVLELAFADLPGPQQTALRVALLLQEPTGTSPDHTAVCAAFLGVIRRLATQTPVLIAVDDLQWLDRPSAMTLDYALRRLGGQQIGLLASVRAGLTDQHAPLAGDGLPAAQLRRLLIGPLALTDFEAAIRVAADERLSRLTIRRLFDASGGNVLYGIELARALGRMEAEPAAGEPLPVPAGLPRVLRSRVIALPEDVRDVLLAASCLRSPTVSMLEQVSGPATWSALHFAAAEGMLEVEAERVRFAHPLLASTIYSGVAPGRRRDAHRKLAVIAPSAEERARHRALAATGPDEDTAAALAAVAQAAAARGAPGTGAELAELAIARTPVDLASARRLRRLQTAEYLFRAGDTTRARRGLEALAEEMPRGPQRAETLLLLARLLLHDAGDLVAVPVLEEALAEAPSDHILQARIHVSLARTCGGDLRYCAKHAEAGLALAQQAGDGALARRALAEKLYADFMLSGAFCCGLADAADDAPEPGLTAVEERASTILGLCMVRADRFDDARHLLERALRTAQEEGDESSLPNLLAHLADLECWSGNWQAAELYAAQSWDAAELVDHRAWRVAPLYARTLVDAHLGRIDAARGEAAEGLSVATAVGDDWALLMLHGVLGFAELSAGNLSAARASLSAAATLADQIGLAEPAAWRFHANYLETLIGRGELERAEAVLAPLEEHGRATGRRWTSATAARCRALLLAAQGDAFAAISALDEALRQHEHLAMPFELARTLLIGGQLQRRVKHKRLAREHLEGAMRIFESLPAPIWADRTRLELSRLGLRPPAPFELTATEERVATLATSGQTNRQVAAALFLSPRTVEDNLARVYRKLGVSSRAELGAAMTRRQSAPPPA